MKESISSTRSGHHFSVCASHGSDANAIASDARALPHHFIDFVFQHRSDATPFGDLARAMFRDPCFPALPEATYVNCVAHVNDVHGGRPDIVEVLADMYADWFGAISFGPNPNGTSKQTFAPREDICNAAMDLGIHTKHGNDFCKAWCPYHTPGDGSGEPSLVLWRDINVFRCESPRCFVWGFPDQLRAGKYQGVHT